MPSIGALLTTSYGRTLGLKLSLSWLAFGGINWRWLTPRLRDTDGPAAMRRSGAFELLLAHAVLLVTAILVRTSPLDH